MTQRKDNRNQDLALLLGIPWSASDCQVSEDDKHTNKKLTHGSFITLLGTFKILRDFFLYVSRRVSSPND